MLQSAKCKGRKGENFIGFPLRYKEGGDAKNIICFLRSLVSQGVSRPMRKQDISMLSISISKGFGGLNEDYCMNIE